MAESLGNTGPSGSVLCPAMEVVLALVDPAHNKAFIPAAAWPHPAGNETVPAIRVLPNPFGSRGGCSRAALVWSRCPRTVRGLHPRHQPRDVPLVSHAEHSWVYAELPPSSQRSSGGFNHRH